MKILIAHNKYKQLGGEDSVLNSEKQLLENMGHKIKLFCVSNDQIHSLTGQIKTAFSCKFSNLYKKKIQFEINSFKPDIVHVHNFFPLLTPSIYDSCAQYKTPVIQTLHNYRIICANALLFRKTSVCEICLRKTPYWAVPNRCYKNSYLGSLAVARMINYHRKRNTWGKKVNHFIVLTEFAKNKIQTANIPIKKISIKPNFFAAPTILPQKKRIKRNSTALFVGRLSQEKGIHTLIKAWHNINHPLHIIGDGPLLNEVKSIAPDTISFLGQRTQEEVYKKMIESAFLVFPSTWYEGFPMVLVEAFAHRLPVISSRIGSMAEIVDDGVTGLHFEAGNPHDLADKATWMFKNYNARLEMGKNAYMEYKKKYTPERNYKMLLDIYQQAIEENQSSNKKSPLT